MKREGSTAFNRAKRSKDFEHFQLFNIYICVPKTMQFVPVNNKDATEQGAQGHLPFLPIHSTINATVDP